MCANNGSCVNETRETSNSYPYMLPIQGVIALYIFIFLMVVLGNSTVVLVVIKKRGMQTFTNWLILNLAVADLSAALICIPLELPLEILRTWIYGHAFCTIFYPIQTSTIYGSVFTLVIMSCSRYWAIIHPFRRQPTAFTAKVLICVIWACSLLVIIPYMLVLKYDEAKQECSENWQHNQKRMYTLANFVFQYVLPLTIISLAYSFIFYELAVKSITKNATAKCLYEDKKKQKESGKVLRLMLIITITFAICIMPYHVVALCEEFGDAARFSHIHDVTLGSYYLLYFNSVLNPIIYNIFSTSFREAFKEFYKNVSRCCREQRESTEVKLMEYYARRFTIINSISIPRSPRTIVRSRAKECCHNNVETSCQACPDHKPAVKSASEMDCQIQF